MAAGGAGSGSGSGRGRRAGEEGLRVAGRGGPVLVFEQLPWHSVAARLTRENKGLQREQQVVRGQLEEHQVRQGDLGEGGGLGKGWFGGGMWGGWGHW